MYACAILYLVLEKIDSIQKRYLLQRMQREEGPHNFIIRIHKYICNSMNEILLLLLLAIYFPFIPILPFVVVIGRLQRLWGIHIFSVYIYFFLVPICIMYYIYYYKSYTKVDSTSIETLCAQCFEHSKRLNKILNDSLQIFKAIKD